MGQNSSKNYPPPYPGETCKDYVARVCGTDYYLINPFIDNLAVCTTSMGNTSPFPKEGENYLFHMDMVRGLCLGDKQAFPWYIGDPTWDKEYMKEAGENWLLVASFWHEIEEKCIRKQKSRSMKENNNKPKLFFTPEQLHAIEYKIKMTSSPHVVPAAHNAPNSTPYSPIYPQLTETEMIKVAALSIGINP